MTRTNKVLVVVILLSLAFVMIHPLRAEEQEKRIPILAVIKESSKDIVSVGEWFKVTIRIVNIGNDTAFNVTLKDEFLPSWAFNITGKTTAHWDLIPPNASAIISYNICVINGVPSVMSLGRARVTYYDRRGVKYIAISDDSNIRVVIKLGEKIDWNAVWRDFVIQEGLIMSILILPLITIELITYRRYKKAVQRK